MWLQSIAKEHPSHLITLVPRRVVKKWTEREKNGKSAFLRAIDSTPSSNSIHSKRKKKDNQAFYLLELISKVFQATTLAQCVHLLSVVLVVSVVSTKTAAPER